MKTKILFIWICNLIDTISTLCLYQTGMFEELNPFMAVLLRNPFIFAIMKIGLITAIIIRLWKEREDKKGTDCYKHRLLDLWTDCIVLCNFDCPIFPDVTR